MSDIGELRKEMHDRADITDGHLMDILQGQTDLVERITGAEHGVNTNTRDIGANKTAITENHTKIDDHESSINGVRGAIKFFCWTVGALGGLGGLKALGIL